jgi:twitching motility protein PilT
VNERDFPVLEDPDDMPGRPAAAPARPRVAAPGPVPVSVPVGTRVGTPVGVPVAGPVSAPVRAPAASQLGVRVERTTTEYLDLDALLNYLVVEGGSDLHLSIGARPMIRLDGEMTPVPGTNVLTEDSLQGALYRMLTPIQQDVYEKAWELDLAYTLPGVSRFRVNILRQRGVVGAVFRVVPSEIKPLESLGMPNVLYSFAGLARGLVLVTGPTGSGKSTTLAALIDRANRTRSGHIITIEDPIEFVHQHRSCVVNQREVGTDTQSYTEALKHVLRQDPDIILIGEMRDLETISIALTAAETGHLVFATLHTQSAQDTISRIIDVFPAGQQQQVRSQLAATLKGVVCQTLVKRADRKGRVPAVEIMVVNSAIATMIRRDDTHQIPQSLQAGGALGMQTLNQHLAEMVAKGIIERETAEEVATDSKDLDALLGGGRLAHHTPLPTPPGGLAGSSL